VPHMERRVAEARQLGLDPPLCAAEGMTTLSGALEGAFAEDPGLSKIAA